MAWFVKLAIGHHKPYIEAAVILGAYGMAYFAIAYILKVEECAETVSKLLRRLKRP